MNDMLKKLIQSLTKGLTLSDRIRGRNVKRWHNMTSSLAWHQGYLARVQNQPQNPDAETLWQDGWQCAENDLIMGNIAPRVYIKNDIDLIIAQGDKTLAVCLKHSGPISPEGILATLEQEEYNPCEPIKVSIHEHLNFSSNDELASMTLTPDMLKMYAQQKAQHLQPVDEEGVA